MRSQTALRFCVSQKETFSNAITFKVITKYGEGAVVQIATVFQSICDVVCRRVQ